MAAIGGGSGSSNSNTSSSTSSHQAPKILLANPALVTAAKYNRGPGGGGGGGGPDDASSSLPSRFPYENIDFTVIGVIGPMGVGKFTIMNEIYSFDVTSPGSLAFIPFFIWMLTPFSIESMEIKAMILLDTQNAYGN
ncbi:unnamed protein product [Lactuca virosa]|uniref:Uncharacterized protein n=1 Tax=Lactuca virosa TaxID=75947 RepID=A0AAU9NTL6_9ASTR|nr:unnamed protein product [Lactuca virosa]